MTAKQLERTETAKRSDRIARVNHERLRYVLDKLVGGSGVAAVDVLIAEVELASGVTGLGFSYVLGGGGEVAAAALAMLAERLKGAEFHHPAATWRALDASLNRSGRGPNTIALAALDVALWDAYAKSLNLPIGVAMGGAPKSFKVYGSGSYNATQSPEQAVEATLAHIAKGFTAVKPRVSASGTAIDLMEAVRDATPSGIDLMCDANEKCSLPQAQRLMAAAREFEFLFVEEPLPSDQLDGYRALANAYPGSIATGEHLQSVAACLPFLRDGLVGTIQPDLAMIGGLTPALELAKVANAFGVDVSPHFLPGLFVHLAAAAPNVAWLEDFPLIEPLFGGWPEMERGKMELPKTPGHGLKLSSGARDAFAVRS